MFSTSESTNSKKAEIVDTNPQANQLKYSIFISTAHKESHHEQALTGDVDYAWTLANEANVRLKGVGQPGAVAIKGLFTEEAVYQYVWKHAAGPNPILHVLINAPNTGYAFSPEGLKKFKEAGGRVLITSVEFYKYTHNEYRTQGLEYLKEAESIIFLDELDKIDALKSFEIVYPKDKMIEPAVASFRQRLESASVIPVPPTIPPISVPFEKRGGDILSFGMIRFGKGFAHVIKLAGLINKSQDVRIKNKKILVVGSVQEHDVRNKELHRLMEAIYPSKVAEIKSATTTELKKLLKNYQQDASLIPQLPMELHIDVPEDQLAPLFNRCKYACLPAYRGASLRNSSISSALAQPFIILTHNGDITPTALRKGGEYEHAMVLSDSNDYNTYAENVLKSLIEREDNPSLNVQSLKAVGAVMNMLSRGAVIQKHLDVYTKLTTSKVPKSELTELQQVKSKAEIKAEQIAFNWILKTQTHRSDKLMKRMTDIDVQVLGEKNYRALLTRLKNLEGPLTKETKAIIRKNRKENEMLTPEEKRFFSALLDGPWTLKHVTEHLDDIKKSGNDMLSVEQRRRQTKEVVANSHTNPAEGPLDNVFFSFGPGDIETARFLDRANDVIVGDVKVLAEQENSTIKNMWSSDHFYAYATEQTSERVNIYGTEYNVCYRLILDEDQASSQWVKECQFIHPDGSIYIEVVKKGDEIFVYPRLDIALVLLTIEKSRLLGAKAWQKIIQETDLSILQSIVNTFYHPGVHEVHKPVRFRIDQLGVSVQTRTSQKPDVKPILFDNVDFQKLMKGIINGNIDQNQIRKIIQEGKIGLDQAVYVSEVAITFMGAAILSGNINLVQELLNVSCSIQASCLAFEFGNSFIELNAVDCVVFMSDTIQAQKLFEKIFPGEKAKLQQNDKIMREVLRLLLDKKCRSNKNSNIIHFTAVDQFTLELTMRRCKPSAEVIQMLLDYSSITSKNLPIVRAAALGSIEIVQTMLKLGANVNTKITDDRNAYVSTEHILPVGYTPLLAAVLAGDLTMCDFLVKNGAAIDQAFITFYTDNIVKKPHAHEGFTALLLAVKLGYVKIAKFLLEQGANLKHRSTNQETAFHLAQNNKDEKMLVMLQKFLSKMKIKQEEIALLEKSKPMPVKFKIKDDRCFGIASYIDQKGERVFIGSGSDTIERAAILTLPDATTIEELVESFLDMCNRGFNLGIGKGDFLTKELGEFELEVPEEQVAQKARIVSIEITNKKKLPQLFKNIDFFKESVAFISGQNIKKLLLNNNSCIEVNSNWFSRLQLEILNVIACMGNSVRAFSSEEKKALEKQYQQAYSRQYALTAAIRVGNITKVNVLLKEGALLNEITLVDYEAKDLSDAMYSTDVNPSLSPIGASILYSQYEIANLIFDRKNFDINNPDVINFGSLFLEKIVRDGELELYKKLHRLNEYNTVNNFSELLNVAVKFSRVALVKYILGYMPATEASVAAVNRAFEIACNSPLFIGKEEDSKAEKVAIACRREIFESLLSDVRLRKLSVHISEKSLAVVIAIGKFDLLEILLTKSNFKYPGPHGGSPFSIFDGLSPEHSWLKDANLCQKMLKLFVSKNGEWSLIVPFVQSMGKKQILPQLIDRIELAYIQVAPQLYVIRFLLEKCGIGEVKKIFESVGNTIHVEALFPMPKNRLLALDFSDDILSHFCFESAQEIAHGTNNFTMAVFLHEKGFAIPSMVLTFLDEIIKQKHLEYFELLNKIKHPDFEAILGILKSMRKVHARGDAAQLLNEWETRMNNQPRNLLPQYQVSQNSSKITQSSSHSSEIPDHKKKNRKK